jgi:hypothetical protein
MFKYQFRLFAIGAAATLAAVTQAAAQCCPVPVSPCCGPAVVAGPQMYVVNQGPVFSGPGSYVTQRNYIEGDQVAPIGYPYVGYVASSTFAPGYGYYSGGYRRYAGRPYIGRPFAYPLRRGFVRRANYGAYPAYRRGSARVFYRGGPVRANRAYIARRPLR